MTLMKLASPIAFACLALVWPQDAHATCSFESEMEILSQSCEPLPVQETVGGVPKVMLVVGEPLLVAGTHAETCCAPGSCSDPVVTALLAEELVLGPGLDEEFVVSSFECEDRVVLELSAPPPEGVWELSYGMDNLDAMFPELWEVEVVSLTDDEGEDIPEEMFAEDPDDGLPGGTDGASDGCACAMPGSAATHQGAVGGFAVLVLAGVALGRRRRR